MKEGIDDFIEKSARVRQYGAAVIVMAFDEEGQADTFQRKVEICTKAYQILTETLGFPPEDIIFDPNVFAIATGIEAHNECAIAFIEACRAIKRHLPHALISGGVSNISFSFRGNNTVREAMHAAFLYHTIQTGMDMGIVNAGHLAVYDDIHGDLLTAVKKILFNHHQWEYHTSAEDSESQTDLLPTNPNGGHVFHLEAEFLSRRIINDHRSLLSKTWERFVLEEPLISHKL